MSHLGDKHGQFMATGRRVYGSRLQCAKQPHQHNVFFQPEGLLPAPIPRDCSHGAGLLLLCGDVESNPGPTVTRRQPPAKPREPRKSRKEPGKPRKSPGKSRNSPGKPAATCDGCKKTFRCHQLSAALKCKRKGCKRKCHRQSACSFISKYNTKPEWECSIHNPDPPQNIRCKRPAYSEKNPDKPSCNICKVTITGTPIICSKCEKCFHKTSCAGVIGRAVQNQFADNPGSWTCKKCSKKDSDLTETIKELPGVSEGKEGNTRESLKIMQWNACYLKTKLVELTEVLKSESIDVLLVQETHLKAEEADPKIEGYASYRGKDRTAMKGGGLITYIKESLKHEKLAKNRKHGTEVSTVRVLVSRNKWVKLTNVYCRPAGSSGEEVKFDTSIIPADVNSVICGDFNGHSELWDGKLKPDDRGDEIVDWAIANDLTVLNDGTATRVGSSGNESTPDVTFCGKELSAKCEWSIAAAIGNSDHLPILTTIQIKVPHQTTLGATSRWRINGVDWQHFTEKTEDEFAKVNPLKNLKDRATRFVSVLTSVATEVVGRSKPGKRSRPGFTPTVKAKIKLRNRLRRNIKEKRKEWKEACQDVNESIIRAKEESWKELLEDVITDADDAKLWRVVKSLNGSPTTNARNEAMIHKGKTITSDKRKADIFLQHYAKVSRLKFKKKRERRLNRRLKKLLRKKSMGPAESSCRDFTMNELEQAIHAMRRKGAAGPDEIPPAFLKALGTHGKTELLAIFNLSFNNAQCPGTWLLAIIIPLLKAKKPASELASYRPISLTSCIVKTLERMVANRLYFLAETNGWIHPSQAGFRKGRSCEDQITRTVQRISDGFNSKPMQRSVMVLLDFSKAYDTVWRERLLLSLADKGVPLPMVRWLNSFLGNRHARVRFNGTMSDCRPMRQGLPQGSVLAPLLFIFYINTLAEILPTNNLNSLFADDVEILATHWNRDVATSDAQAAVDVVSQWSHEWKLNLNASKSEVAYFSTWTKEPEWNAEIKIDGEPIAFTHTPRLLGVTLDRQLTFGEHVKNVSKAATGACRMLSALANSNFGWRKQYLVRVYRCMIMSKMDYAGPAWQGNIADCHKLTLERSQNRALRLITGQFADSPLESLRAETGIPSFDTHIKRNLLISKEKALRLDDSHPRRRAAEDSIPKRVGLTNNSKHSWASITDQLTSSYNLGILATSRKPLTYFPLAPWLDETLPYVFPELPGLKCKDEPEELRRELAYARIRELQVEYVLYSDGSAAGGVENGGAGVVVTFGDPEDPTVVDTLMKRGSALTSSYNEEHTAMHVALDWIGDHCTEDTRVAIVTDSQSLCVALLGHGHEIKDLRRRIIETQAMLKIQWVPGHSGIVGNELADLAAKHATTLDEVPTEIPFGSACARIKSVIRDDHSSHARTARVYAKYSKQKEAEVKTRNDQVLLGRIRTGHHWHFESYHQLVDKEHDTTCEECGFKLHDLKHWLCDCPATAHIRMRLFGTSEIFLEILTENPLAAILFTRAALSNTQQLRSRQASQDGP